MVLFNLNIQRIKCIAKVVIERVGNPVLHVLYGTDEIRILHVELVRLEAVSEQDRADCGFVRPVSEPSGPAKSWIIPSPLSARAIPPVTRANAIISLSSLNSDSSDSPEFPMRLESPA